ncbi:Metallo-dependent phosphatase [Ceratobasidium sp. AG-I]|nr:Metallo-dependent phosphatase [Ceratobasidium sp. AG-I]
MKELTDSKRRTRTYPKPVIINGLRFFWICLIVWLEVGVFHWSLRSCHWPDKEIQTARRPHPTHVMLIADPQVIDHRSYPGRRLWFKALTQFIVDSNLRKSWRAAKRLSPNMVIFLGDMMDGGRYRMLDEEYEAYHSRFNNIFRMSSDVPKYYLVGNHDVGLGKSQAFSARARQRYLAHFGGVTNYQVTVANHSFIFIDAPSLVEEDYRRYEAEEAFEDWPGNPGGAIEFINRLAQEGSPKPRILFSHIPLSRSAGASCGALRERGSIQRGAGMGYQNLLGRHTTQFLLDNTNPIMVYSGDDHDYCDIRHPRSEGTGMGTREVSVKSFSMAMGVKRPGFQLLSLVSPDPASPYARTLADTPCHLPDQMRIYTHVYAIWGFLSILALIYVNARRGNSATPDYNLAPLKTIHRPQARMPLRSSSLNVPTPRVLRSRSASPIGSPIIPSSPVLMPTIDDDEIAYPPSSPAPPTPASYFDLGGEEHSFSLPPPNMADQKPRRPTSWMRTSSSSKRGPGWVEARQQSHWAAARNLLDLIGCARSRGDAGFVRRLVGDFGACAWPPVVVLLLIWANLFW